MIQKQPQECVLITEGTIPHHAPLVKPIFFWFSMHRTFERSIMFRDYVLVAIMTIGADHGGVGLAALGLVRGLRWLHGGFATVLAQQVFPALPAA